MSVQNPTRPDELRVTALVAGYDRVPLVHGIDLRLAAGEIVALFGPNGAGKTTTLLTVAGLLSSLGGEIIWRDVPAGAPPHVLARRGICLVPGHSVFTQLSTEANLRLGRGDPERALALFPELRPLLRRRAGLLSGGEQQILAMGRALASEPRVLLLDEVSAGLAPLVVRRLYAAARAAADAGVAILLVEQQVRRAFAIADRGYVLQRGRVVAAGTVEELARLADNGSGPYAVAPDTGAVPGTASRVTTQAAPQ